MWYGKKGTKVSLTGRQLVQNLLKVHQSKFGSSLKLIPSKMINFGSWDFYFDRNFAEIGHRFYSFSVQITKRLWTLSYECLIYI